MILDETWLLLFIILISVDITATFIDVWLRLKRNR